MAADWLEIHPVNPHQRQLAQVAVRLRGGAVIAYPTDSCYALGCHLDDREAADRLRRIRDFDRHHQFTLVCRDLSEIATYARVDNQQYRLLKTLTPGPYTFILQASREIPKRILDPKRKTIGLRIPDHPVVQGLLAELGEPLLSATLTDPSLDTPLLEPEELFDRYQKSIDLMLDVGACGLEPTTILDLTGPRPLLVREGRGDVSRILDLEHG